MTDLEFNNILQEIITALKEKGYSPYEQIVGYLKTDSEMYITRYGDARNKIKILDKYKLKEYIENNTIA